MSKAKQTMNYVHKYGGALKGVPVLEPNELAIKTKSEGLKKIHPLDVKYEGYTFGTMKDMYMQEVSNHSDLKSIVKQAIQDLVSSLKEKGYNTPNTELNVLISDIDKLLIIKPTEVYFNFTTNKDGYVIDKEYIDTVTTSHIEIPDDYNKGYWKIVDGKFVLDEEKYKQLWGAL